MNGGGGLGFDWAGLMRAGLRDLHLAPRDFWALTPFELLLMLGREGSGTAMARARLEELAAAYPDARPRDSPENSWRITDARDRYAG